MANVMRNILVKLTILFSLFVCFLQASDSFASSEEAKDFLGISVISSAKNQVSSIYLDRSVGEELLNLSEIKVKKSRSQRGKWKSSLVDFAPDDLSQELNAGYPKLLSSRALADIAKQLFGKLHYCEEILSSSCHPPTKYREEVQ